MLEFKFNKLSDKNVQLINEISNCQDLVSGEKNQNSFQFKHNKWKKFFQDDYQLKHKLNSHNFRILKKYEITTLLQVPTEPAYDQIPKY